MKLTRLISAMPLLAFVGTLFAQPVQGPNGNYYEFIAGPISWNDAKTAAESMNLIGSTGHLATITSAEENSFVATLGAANTAYLGGNDIDVEGTWVWLTGEAWNYQAWGPGEPNNSGGEDCLHYRPDGLWNDIPCGTVYNRGYIVEYEAADFIPQTNTFATEVIPAEAGAPEMTISCNGGLPLTQSGAAGSTFSVIQLTVGTECTVGLSGDMEDGFQAAEYTCGLGGIAGDDGCTFTVEPGITAWTTTLYAEPIPVDFEVTVDWDISPNADIGLGEDAYVELVCESLWSKPGYSSTTLDAGPDVDMPLTLTNLQPDPDGSSYCYAYLYAMDSAVEIDNECIDVDLELGEDASCTITATAFYEGIPTLSQYGMAIMALLMLGVGFIGLRRFV